MILSKLWYRLTDPLFYRKRLLQLTRPLRPKPRPCPVTLEELLEREGPVVVAIAHPDDELFASGLLCELAERGRGVRIVCLTRGEGGTSGDVTREELGRVREAELRASAALLGVDEVHFLGHVDPVGKEYRVYAPAVSVQALAEQLAPLLDGAAFVVTHGSGGEYWHPAHLLMHDAVRSVIGKGCPLLTLHAWQAGHPLPGLLNREDPADLVIDGSGNREQRLAAFRAHRSQEGYFASRGGGSLEGYVDRTVKEAFRHHPAEH